MKIVMKFILTLLLITSSIINLISQEVKFIEGIKNSWSFFRDRIIYSSGNSIYYRLNDDPYLYFSSGTKESTFKTEYVFGESFTTPDLGVFASNESFTALATEFDPNDILIFKNNSEKFEYVENDAEGFNGMIFFNNKLYYLISQSKENAEKLVEYDPVTKLKKDILTFDAKGAFGITELNGKLIVIGYKNGNSLLSVDPITGNFTTIFKFNASNSYAPAVNMKSTDGRIYFWYPNGNSTYSLYTSEGIEGTTVALFDNLDDKDAFTYFANNIINVADGKILASVNYKNEPGISRLLFSDGTINNTKILQYKDVTDFDPYDIVHYCNSFYFIGTDESGSRKLFSTDGTIEGTKKLANNRINSMVKFNKKLYLSAEVKANNFDFSSWNDEESKFYIVKDVNDFYPDPNPRELTATNDKLYFVANKTNVFAYALATFSEPLRDEEECLTSSSSEVIDDFNLVVFPNPFDQEVSIESNEFLPGATIDIFDAYGKLIDRVPQIESKTTVNTNDWASGFYYIILKNFKSKVSNIKICKL